MNRWSAVRPILESALDRPEADREGYVRDACGGDEALRAEVSSFLERASRARVLIESDETQSASSSASSSLDGESLGHYDVIQELGRGGMGIVYRARDTRLGRDVAIKVLPDAFVTDRARLMMLQHEARTLASVEHENIVTIHSLEEDRGRHFLVMQYIDGGTLRRRMAEPLAFRVALEYARQIANGLAQAHRSGILHRDLKPDNVLVERSGRLKIVDFGLATLTASSPDVPAPAGTRGYMSPEQSAGRPLDVRSDVFSFGVVLRELFSGVSVPHSLKSVIAKATEERPDGRYESMDEVLRALARIDSHVVVLATVSAAAVLGIGVLMAGSGTSDISVPSTRVLTSYPGIEGAPSLSPDGTKVAFTWRSETATNRDLFVRDVSGGEPVRLTETERSETDAAWSPNGSEIAFVRRSDDGQDVYIVPSGGDGEERLVARSRAALRARLGLSWSPDGTTLAFSDRDDASSPIAIHFLDLTTGASRRVTSPTEDDGVDRNPAFSPNGRALAFVRQTSSTFVRDVFVTDLPGGRTRRVTYHASGVLGVTWSADGTTLIYSSQHEGPHALYEVPSNGGRPVRLPGVNDNAQWPHASGDRIVHEQWLEDWNLWEAPLTADGVGDPRAVVTSTRREANPQVSPDGESIAFVSGARGAPDIWVSRRDGSEAAPLTTLGQAFSPSWSPHGDAIAFTAFVEGDAEIYVVSSDGGTPRRLTDVAAQNGLPTWSRDGRFVYFSSDRHGARQIWKVPAAGGEATQVTRGGGMQAFESARGDALFVVPPPQDGPGLTRIDGRGSSATRLAEHGVPGQWAVTSDAIFFLEGGRGSGPVLRRLDLEDGTLHELGELARGRASLGLSVAPAGDAVLYVRDDISNDDLVLVEGYR